VIHVPTSLMYRSGISTISTRFILYSVIDDSLALG